MSTTPDPTPDPSPAGDDLGVPADGADAADAAATADGAVTDATDAPDASVGDAPDAAGPVASSEPAPSDTPTDAGADLPPAGAGLAASPSDVVYLDRIGTVDRGGPSSSAGPVTVLVLGVPESAKKRMEAAGGFTLIEDRGRLAEAALVLVSTRTPKGELATTLAGLRGSDAPVVALAHTGGENLAVDVIRAGGRGVVAEGNERALLGYATGEAYDTSLVETYDRQVARSRSGDDRGASTDAVTNLPSAAAFSRRLAELGQTGDVPRIGFLRVLSLDRGGRSLSPQGLGLLRRRLAMQFRKLAADAGVELFAMSDEEFAFLSPNLSPNRAEQLGHRMARVTEMFAPTGSRPLSLAVGHAGPEVSGELSTLRELAHRAMAVAGARETSGVVGADALALGASATIELEAAQRIVLDVEPMSPLPPGHGERTAALAAAIAFELGYDGPECARIRLAAHLHEIGLAGLDASTLAPLESLDAEQLAARRAAPTRGAAYVRTSAGDEVADAIAATCERWDGSGYPRGLAAEAIPVGARVIAVACRFAALVAGGRDGDPEPLSPDDAIAVLAEESDTSLDPALVTLATPVLLRALAVTA